MSSLHGGWSSGCSKVRISSISVKRFQSYGWSKFALSIDLAIGLYNSLYYAEQAVMLCDRHVRQVRAARKHWNDSGRVRRVCDRSGQHDEVGVSSAVLGNLQPDVQRVSLQQTPADVSTVALHRRVAHDRWPVIRQFLGARVLSTNTLRR